MPTSMPTLASTVAVLTEGPDKVGGKLGIAGVLDALVEVLVLFCDVALDDGDADAVEGEATEVPANLTTPSPVVQSHVAFIWEQQNRVFGGTVLGHEDMAVPPIVYSVSCVWSGFALLQ